MAVLWRMPAVLSLAAFVVMASHLRPVVGMRQGPNTIGVCYGTNGDNLPPPAEVVAMYRQYQVDKMRIYNPNPAILQALQDSQSNPGTDCIYVTVGVPDEEIASVAGGVDAANQWVQTHLSPYNKVCFSTVTVGNEVVPGPLAQHVAPAMRNMRAALDSHHLSGVRVSTSVSSAVLGTSYPPSQGSFSNEAMDTMKEILTEIANHGDAKLLVNLYPYFAYTADPSQIQLPYAQGTATEPTVVDQGLQYYNLFSAMLDAFYSAMEAVGMGKVGAIVSETGWPSAGNGGFTTQELAKTYNTQVKWRLDRGGSPKRPDDEVEVFIFAMFNENQKPEGQEQNFGLFHADKTPVYPFFGA